MAEWERSDGRVGSPPRVRELDDEMTQCHVTPHPLPRTTRVIVETGRVQHPDRLAAFYMSTSVRLPDLPMHLLKRTGRAHARKDELCVPAVFGAEGLRRTAEGGVASPAAGTSGQ